MTSVIAGSGEVWWLDVGSEVCDGCGHSYVIETGHYCTDCDSALCSICVETVLVAVTCHDCRRAVKEGGRVGSGDVES